MVNSALMLGAEYTEETKSQCSQGACGLVGEADKRIHSDSTGYKVPNDGVRECREGGPESAWGLGEGSEKSETSDGLEGGIKVKWRRGEKAFQPGAQRQEGHETGVKEGGNDFPEE